MILFGIDPGTAVMGWGVISAEGSRLTKLDCGAIKPHVKWSLPQKLAFLYDGLVEPIARWKPAFVCIEEAFYAKNVHTTLVLGHARGVAMLAAQQSGAGVLEFSPMEIKKALVGSGNAGKDQVAYMVNLILGMQNETHVSDITDALAAAICGNNHASAAAALSRKRSD